MRIKMKPEIRRLNPLQKAFECEICGTEVKRGKRFEYRPYQYVNDHIPRHLTDVCRKCIYKEVFPNKGSRRRLKENQIEEESHKYASID